MAFVTLDSLRDLAVRGYERGYTILKSLPAALAYLSQAVAMGRFETRPDKRPSDWAVSAALTSTAKSTG